MDVEDVERRRVVAKQPSRNRTSASQRTFVDACTVYAKAGRGGDGCVSFEHLAPGKKTPNGGHGGRGGDVVVVATNSVRDLALPSFHPAARDGVNGGPKGKVGKQGKSREIRVPVGTLVFARRSADDPLARSRFPMDDAVAGSVVDSEAEADEEDEDEDDEDEQPKRGGRRVRGGAIEYDMSVDDEDDNEDEDEDEDARISRVLLADLNKEGASVVVAAGGAPGRGNIAQARASFEFYEHDQALRHVKGQAGQEVVVDLKLKTIADVGLVGFPNAGKSSLLGAISLAAPKVASYPFTTLHPHVGYVDFTDGFRIAVADLPGLVDGAHENRGMGHSFLQHVERTRVIVYVVDVAKYRTWTWRREVDEEANADADARDKRTSEPGDDLDALVRELELYQPGLSLYPSIVVANKIDAEGWEAGVESLRWRLPRSADGRLFAISAQTGAGLGEFVRALRLLVERVGPVHHRNVAERELLDSDHDVTPPRSAAARKKQGPSRDEVMEFGMGKRGSLQLRKLMQARGVPSFSMRNAAKTFEKQGGFRTRPSSPDESDRDEGLFGPLPAVSARVPDVLDGVAEADEAEPHSDVIQKKPKGYQKGRR